MERFHAAVLCIYTSEVHTLESVGFASINQVDVDHFVSPGNDAAQRHKSNNSNASGSSQAKLTGIVTGAQLHEGNTVRLRVMRMFPSIRANAYGIAYSRDLNEGRRDE